MHLLESAIRSEELLAKTIDVKYRFYASSSEPLQLKELLAMAAQNNDHQLIEAYHDHSLGYADSGGSLDLRQQIENSGRLHRPDTCEIHFRNNVFWNFHNINKQTKMLLRFRIMQKQLHQTAHGR